VLLLLLPLHLSSLMRGVSHTLGDTLPRDSRPGGSSRGRMVHLTSISSIRGEGQDSRTSNSSSSHHGGINTREGLEEGTGGQGGQGGQGAARLGTLGGAVGLGLVLGLLARMRLRGSLCRSLPRSSSLGVTSGPTVATSMTSSFPPWGWEEAVGSTRTYGRRQPMVGEGVGGGARTRSSRGTSRIMRRGMGAGRGVRSRRQRGGGGQFSMAAQASKVCGEVL
jgi:hypothetical protein